MRDRDPEQLNKKDDLVDVKELVRDAEPGPFTLDDILAEYGVKREPEPEAVPRRIESRSQPQRTEKDNVVLFPGARSAPVPEPPQAAEKENAREPEEDREPESGEDAEDQEGEDEEPNDRVVEFPEEESVLSAFLKDVTRKADHYADHMFQESEEMDQEEIHRLEKLIPGTDVEEDEPEEFPGRFRRPRRPEPPPPDTAPQELARQYGKGLKVMRLRVILVFLLAAAALFQLAVPAAGFVWLPPLDGYQVQVWIAAGLLGAGILTFCGLNQHYYGVFALSDFSTGSFADAMGAMARVEAPEGYTPLVAVTKGARELLYENVPELAPLEYWLEEDPQLQNDFRDPELDDYRVGSFYWAIRRAAQYEGIYDTAAGAEQYWQSVADRINALCDDGTLPSWTGKRSSTTPPIRGEHVLPVLAESAKGALWALTFQDCAPYETLRSIGTQQDYDTWTGYLHCGVNGAAEAGKDTPYYSPTQKLVFGLMQGIRYLYAVLLPLSFLYALYLNLKNIPSVFKGRQAGRILPWGLLWLLLFMAALRCAMIAFVEVSSFGIGTSTMYLATVHPLLILFAAVGIFTARRTRHADA